MISEIFKLIEQEESRQQSTLTLIPSENHSSRAVREAVGSVLADKYAEGYPGKRYYQGNKIVDLVENRAVELCKDVFGLDYANVQPYSGSPANLAVYLGLLNPGDTVLGMTLSSGGHLTHGHKVSVTGRWFRSVQYGLDQEGRIDYEQIAALIEAEKPKLVIAGTTAYPWNIDWRKLGELTDNKDTTLLADISHIAGLVASGVVSSPVPFVDVVTSTTHKTLRGPRGAFLGVTERGTSRNPELIQSLSKAVFPGLQGGPHMNNIAGIAVCFEEAKTEDFKRYSQDIVENAKILAEEIRGGGLNVWGTENHLMLIEVGIGRGREMADRLEEVGIIVNANTVPNEKGSPMNPSGIRVGTPAVTTRGMGRDEMKILGGLVVDTINNGASDNIKKLIKDLCLKFPVPK